MHRTWLLTAALAGAVAVAHAQQQPDPRTLIPSNTLNGIAQHISGAQARLHVLRMCRCERNRPPEDYHSSADGPRSAGRRSAGYYAMEARNSADGQRSLLDIRNGLAAEFGSVPPDDMTKFFRDLERTGA